MAATLLGLLALSASVVSAAVAPLSVPPSQTWDGNDGSWSSFGIQVGTPPQSARVLPSTSQNSIWLVLGEGCQPLTDPTDCSQARGLVFRPDTSKSWARFGTYYKLVYTPADALGYEGNGEYAYDNVTLGFPGMGPAVGAQMIQGFAAQDPFINVLGLDPQAINLTSLQNFHPSLLANLYGNGTIPSLSWGYTAGAIYKKPPIFGSLTLGGYDTTRLVSNSISIPFGADVSRALLVGLKSIKSNLTDAALLPEAIFTTIDTLVSTIWLPLSACAAFEKAFNLTWDNATERYFINDATHNTLLKQNPTITFAFSSALSGAPEVDIVLPYAAFDLQLGLPFVQQSTRYFPLQRAADESQYIIGRTLLQEAYIYADYHRHNFTIAQALFPSTSVASNLVAILPPSGTSHPNHTAAIAGGAAGAAVVVIAVLLVAFFVVKRRRRARQSTNTNESGSDLNQEDSETAAKLQATVRTVPVSDGELDAEGAQIFELPASFPRMELESPHGTNVPPSELPSPEGTHMGIAETPSPESTMSATNAAVCGTEKSEAMYETALEEEGLPAYEAKVGHGTNAADSDRRFDEEVRPNGRRRFSWED